MYTSKELPYTGQSRSFAIRPHPLARGFCYARSLLAEGRIARPERSCSFGAARVSPAALRGRIDRAIGWTGRCGDVQLCLTRGGRSIGADEFGLALVVRAEAHELYIMHAGVRSARRRKQTYLHAILDPTATGPAKTSETVQLILRAVQVLRSCGASGAEPPNRDGGDPAIV